MAVTFPSAGQFGLRPSVYNSALQQVLQQSGYNSDGSDFKGFAKTNSTVGYYDVKGGVTPAIGNGVADDRSAIASSDTTAQVLGQTLLFQPSTYLIGTDLTITSPIKLLTGAKLKPAANVTITIVGWVDVGVYQWIDTSLGGKVVFLPSAILGVYPRWWGAVANGVTDDSAAFLAAYAALPDAGGVIYVPASASPYVLNASALVVTTKPVIIQGEGWKSLVADVFGGVQWAAAGAIIGTVLKVTGTTDGIVSNDATNRGLFVRDLAILGPGTGTSVGLNLGAGAQTLYGGASNVMVANFSKGVRLNGAIELELRNVLARGCIDGYSIEGSTTECTLFRAMAEVCTVGFHPRAGAGIHTFGMLMQSNTTGIKIEPNAAGGIQQYTFTGLWSESNTTPLAFDSTTAAISAITFDKCRESTAGTITSAGANGISRITFRECEYGGVSFTPSPQFSDLVLDRANFGTFDPANCARVSINRHVTGRSVTSDFRNTTNPAGAAYTPDWRDGPVYELTLGANITISVPTKAPASDSTEILFILRQDGTGGRTVTWGAGYHVDAWSDTGNLAFKYKTVRFRQAGAGQWIQMGAATAYFS